jgi:hypothetical protein
MTAADPRDGSSRVEREVLEILERADASHSPVEHLQAAMRRRRQSARARVAAGASSVRLPKWLSPATLRIVAALVLAFGAYSAAGASRPLGLILAIASALVFFSLWVAAIPSQNGGRPRWRGQDLDDDSQPFGFDRERGPKRPR